LSCSLSDYPPSLPVDFFGSPFFFFSFFFFSFSFFFLGFVSFIIGSKLILNYTETRDRNCTKWNDGKMKKHGNHSPPKNKLVQDSEGNEEN
jgi:hypothetical protein